MTMTEEAIETADRHALYPRHGSSHAASTGVGR